MSTDDNPAFGMKRIWWSGPAPVGSAALIDATLFRNVLTIRAAKGIAVSETDIVTAETAIQAARAAAATHHA